MKKIILSALMLTGMLTFAQEGKLTVSGTVDVYGSTNFSDDYTGAPGVLVDNLSNGFGLGMANTVFAYQTEKAGVVADLAYGPRGNAANMYGGGIINQLYAYYSLSESVTVTAGQFNTFYGYEVISPAANFNYSVSYLFAAGPFSHTGVKVDIAASDDLSFMLAFTNPHGEYSGSNVTDTYQVGGQIGYKGQYLNMVYGDDGFGIKDAFLIDYTGGFDLSDSFYLGINAAYQTDVYSGAALYLEYAATESLSIGLRPEYFSPEGGDDITVGTLTLNKSLTDNLTLITEFRLDSSDAFSEDIPALTAAAVYSF